MARIVRSLASVSLGCALIARAAAAPAPYPNPGVEAPGSVFSAAISGFAVAYFTGEAGGFTNLAGLRVNGIDLAIGLNNQTSAYGDRFVFGAVNAGDVLDFFIDVLDTGDRFYNDKSLNADGVNHTWTQSYGGDQLVPPGFNLAWEDWRGGGDFNYRDHSFVIRIEQEGLLPIAPTSALVLLLLALMPIAGRRRR